MISDAAWLNFLRSTSLICNGTILVIAVIWLLGPKLLRSMSNFFDKYHSSLNLEKLLFTKGRVILGCILLVLSFLMLTAVIKIRI